ncbi:MAG: ABC transporter permease [Candidatus Bathyarchaeia archaeon]
MPDLLTSTIVSILSMMPVFALAAMGQLLSQKSGDYNLGIEGIMASGAVFAIIGVYFGLNSWASIGLGVAVGVAFGAFLSILIDKVKLNQIVVGFGIWFLSLGLAGSIYTAFLSGKEIKVAPIPPILFSLDPIFYLTIIVFITFLLFFSYTKQGLAVQAAGENPRAADSSGINVDNVRMACNIVGGALMGLSGAYLAINTLQGFMYTMIAGYGWIAFALVIFGRWNTVYVFTGAILFTAIMAVSNRLEMLGLQILPPNYIFILPHISVLIGLTLSMIFLKESGMPSALGQPYKK